jgi:protein ImuB
VVHPTLPAKRGARPTARLQVVLEGEDDDLALLLEVAVGNDPQWTVEGIYD